MSSIPDTMKSQLHTNASRHLENCGSDTQSTVLIALDGSPASQSAARLAVHIARSQGLSVEAMYVADLMVLLGGKNGNYQAELGKYQEPHSEPEAIGLFERQALLAFGWLREICHQEQVPVKTDFVLGGVTELILSRADHAWLVSMGRRGNGHATQTLHLGRNFRSIARQTHRPIIAAGEVVSPIQHVLLAYDGNTCSEDMLSWASCLQRALSCQLTVLSVGPDGGSPDSLPPGILDALEQHALSYNRIVVRTGQAADEIARAAQEFDVQLILMDGCQRESLPKWPKGSTVEAVLHRTPLPVLIT